MRRHRGVVLLSLLTLALPPATCSGEPANARGDDACWVAAVRAVHARFTGKNGTFAQLGDSITVTQAFWAPLRYARNNAPPEMERALRIVTEQMRPECWGEWKGPQFGSEGGKTIRWAEENVDGWLKRLNPEVALIGYDVPTLLARDGVHPSHPKQYQNNYSREALDHCGYSLRNYLALMKYAEVLEALMERANSHRVHPVDLASLTVRGLRLHVPQAPPLPAPAGEVLRAATVEELFAAAARVKPGGTILVADGNYRLARRLEIGADNVTLRGASGHREKVVLDGGGTLGELLAVTACSGVTIADLTVRNVRWNGIKINSETNVQRLTIHNCVLHNIWQRGVKGVKVPEKGREQIRPTGCRIEYCLFYNDRPKQFSDDPADTPQNFGGNYIGGIDTMYARDWVIRDNVFVGIQGRTRSARGAIFMWHEAVGCTIERNIILDCDSGICLGNSHKPEDVAIHCTRFVVRNNFVTHAPENGILADYTRDCKIVHNTIYDPANRLGRLIRLVHDNDGLLVANNLVSGPKIRNESASRIAFRNNLEEDLTGALVAPAAGDLRLTPRAVAAIDRAVPLPEVTDDIDCRPRGPKPDIGAHELQE